MSGCIDNDNCPEGYVCNDSHLCESDNGVCVTDPECIGYDVTCNVAHDNCFFCGDDSDCASSNGCCPGKGRRPKKRVKTGLWPKR